MKDDLFLIADLWMVYAGFFCGWRFLRDYDNYLLGIEWMIVATSGVNYLVWALLGAHEGNAQSHVVFFFDAFSRSVGITLILVLGLMRVTHGYRPSLAVDVGAFGLAAVAGLFLQQYGGNDLHVGPATFFVVVNALTTLFLAYFAWRLWEAGTRKHAVAVALVTVAACAVAVIYDFLKIPGDDKDRTWFAIIALTTWGTQLFVYFRAYRALHDHNVAAGLQSSASSLAVAA